MSCTRLSTGMPGPEHRLSPVTVKRALTMLSAEEVNELLKNCFATVRTALLEMMTESRESVLRKPRGTPSGLTVRIARTLS